MAGDYDRTSIAEGLKRGAFQDLSSAQKKKLIKLMARLAEKSYRRGFQQGKEAGQYCIRDMHKFRFEESLNKSPNTDTEDGYSAIDRLWIECPVLSDIGFVREIHDARLRRYPR